MRRREFITLIGGAAATLPLAARAQQPERMRRIGVLVGSGTDADDSDMQSRFIAFSQALQQMGWTDGRNVRIDYRHASGDPESIRRYAAELVALAPDVIVTGGAAAVPPVLQASRTIPMFLPTWSIRSVPVSLTIWRGRAATPPALSCWNTARARNGSNYSRKSRQE